MKLPLAVSTQALASSGVMIPKIKSVDCVIVTMPPGETRLIDSSAGATLAHGGILVDEASAPADGKPDFAKLVLVHEHRLHHRARNFCRNADEARDLVQDTLLRALKHFASLRPDSNIRGWLMTIMINLYRDRQRRHRRSREVAFEEWHDVADELPPPPAHPTLDREQIDAAIARLPADQNKMLRMKAFENLRYRDIGERLGIPPNTVGTRLRRARKALLQILGMGGAE